MSNGAWFAGWGYMRFWESERANGAFNFNVASEARGYSEDELFHGCGNVDHDPRLPGSALGASPSEFEHMLRRFARLW